MRKQRDRYFIYNVVTALAFFVGVMKANNAVIAIAVALLAVSAFSWNPNELFCLLVAIIPFQSNIRLWGLNAVPVVAAAIVFGRMKKKDSCINRISFLCGIVVLSIELMNDIFHTSSWSLISWLSVALICIYLIAKIQIDTLSPAKVIMNFCMGVGLAILANVSGMDMETSTVVYRFGSANISLGGAMGIPLYVLLLTSILMVALICLRYSALQRTSMILGIVVLNIFGLLSVSRAYLLGLGVIAACALLGLFTRKRGKMFRLVLLVVLMGIVAGYLYYDELLRIVASFQFRFQTHSSDNGRTSIWLSCLDYLQNDLQAILVGRGIYHYKMIGKQLGESFSMSAHNVFIDSIMAFGLIGTGGIVGLYGDFAARCKRNLLSKANIVTMMPLITLLVYYMTSGSFEYLKTWLYFIMTIFFMYNFARRKEK